MVKKDAGGTTRFRSTHLHYIALHVSASLSVSYTHGLDLQSLIYGIKVFGASSFFTWVLITFHSNSEHTNLVNGTPYLHKRCSFSLSKERIILDLILGTKASADVIGHPTNADYICKYYMAKFL
jgi:hypothetical protein